MAETIWECIEQFGTIDSSNIEKTRQDFEKLKEDLRTMIPHLDWFDTLVMESRQANFIDHTKSDIVDDILMSGHGARSLGIPVYDDTVYDGYWNLVNFLDSNPWFKELFIQYIILRDSLKDETWLNNLTTQALADCLEEVTKWQ